MPMTPAPGHVRFWSCPCGTWHFDLVLATCEEELREEDELCDMMRAHTDHCIVFAATQILRAEVNPDPT